MYKRLTQLAGFIRKNDAAVAKLLAVAAASVAVGYMYSPPHGIILAAALVYLDTVDWSWIWRKRR